MAPLRLTLIVSLMAPSFAAAQFTNVTSASGLEAIVQQQYQQDPDWWLSGQHFVDLDADGDLDLYLSGHGTSAVAALNDGTGSFTRATGGYPESEIHLHYDADGDGKTDVTLTHGDGGGQWWRNTSTPGSLSFAATSIVRGEARAQVLADVNGDGKVDWLRSATPGVQIDLGDGLGGFQESSSTLTVPGANSNNTVSLLPADFDGDGDVDLLAMIRGGYEQPPTSGRTIFFRNAGNGSFSDATAGSGLIGEGLLAKGIGDLDQDGDTDVLAIVNKAMPPAVYLNNGAGVFTLKPNAVSGIPAATLELAAWGTAVTTDFDNDGLVDILMNGRYYLKLLRGTGGGSFTYMNAAWGIVDDCACAVDDGLAFGDVDGDGDLDLTGYRQTWPTRLINLYRNDLPAKNWLRVRPVGRPGNHGATGAKIRVYAAGTNQLLWYEQVATYCFQSANSYYGHAETERHFGLGSRTSVDVEVQFQPSGVTTRRNGVAANSVTRILEQPFAKGDLDGDLEADLVLRNTGTGENVAWLMNGTVLDQALAVSPTPATGWQIVGVDDFNGDQRNDLVLASGAGAVEFWLMNGVTRIGAAVPLTSGALPPPWKIAATADFDHDGRPDLLWRNTATQKLEIARMYGTLRAGTIVPTPDQAVAPNWEVVGAQDWNGDHDTDLLWYNVTSGKLVLWFMNAAVVRVGATFTNPAAAGANNWKVLAMGDYGIGPGGLPGTKDVVWRNASSGRFVVWHMDQAGNRTAGVFTTPDAPANPLAWTIVGPR